MARRTGSKTPERTTVVVGKSENSTAASAEWLKPSLVVLALCVGLTAGLFISWNGNSKGLPDREAALAAAKAGDSQAEIPLTQLLESNPQDLEVIKALLSIAMVKDQPDVADRCLELWCDLEPSNLVPLQLRMEIATRVFNHAVAIACGKRLLALETDRAMVLRKLTDLEILAGELEDAEQHAGQGLELQPNQPEFQLALAQIHHMRGHSQEASEILDSLLQANPNLFPAMLLRGTIYREDSQVARAIPMLRQVISQEPTSRLRQLARYQLAQALYQANQTAEADEHMATWMKYEEARRLLVDAYQQTTNQELRLRASRALLESGQDAEATGLLRAIIASDPTRSEAHQLLAEYYLRAGQPDQARFHQQFLTRQN